MKNKIILHKKTLAYICLVHLVLKLIVKLKVNFYLCSKHNTVTFSMVCRIRIRDGPRVENH